MDNDTFNQTKITLYTNGDNKDVAKDDENVVDDDDDPIMGNEIKNQQQYGFQVPKENSKLLNKTTALKGATIATETAAAIRTIETTKYLKTKQKPIEYENENYKPKNHHNQNRYHYHKHYKHNHKTNHLYDYLLTTLKFNQGNSFYLNNKLKTIIEKDAMDNDAKQNEYNERQTDKDLKEEEEEKQHEEKPKNNDNIKEKFQMKYVPAITPSFGFSNGWLGQLPQFQIPTLLPQQQLQLFLQQPMQQQQQEQQQQSTIFTTASLLPQEYHHLSDYRFLFNAERHTEFYLHTLTNPPDYIATAAAAVATKDAATQTTTTTTLASFEESEDTDEDVDDDVYYDNDYFNDNDDDDNVKDDEKLSTTMLNLTNPRVLNVVTDTIGAVFGVNTRPVAGIQGIHIEEIELYNGLSLRQSRFNPFNPCR